LAGQPALGSVLVVSNFFHSRIMKATVHWEQKKNQKKKKTMAQIVLQICA